MFKVCGTGVLLFPENSQGSGLCLRRNGVSEWCERDREGRFQSILLVLPAFSDQRPSMDTEVLFQPKTCATFSACIGAKYNKHRADFLPFALQSLKKKNTLIKLFYMDSQDGPIKYALV